ncbi:unnamed protein product [Adineta ricciae]|uniref:Helix-turn-helix domain-containing protein n=2 Tax=Adineta ricciae TaxID=249248 RepID=A0A815TET4_ADIRI|nr:unnamed protein product [Adineta ricciae]
MALRYTLPYVVGQSKMRHSEWFRSALLRAVCYCSSAEDFHQERIYPELTYLVNGYSFYFVESHVQHFFDYFELQMQRSTQLQELNDNNQVARFNYYYNYWPRCEFNRYFHELWSRHFASHPTLR